MLVAAMLLLSAQGAVRLSVHSAARARHALASRAPRAAAIAGRSSVRARALATMSTMAEQEAAEPGFYVTTPIYYVNDKPHIGHAYTTIASDAFARFNRLDGKRVRLLTGTDEHGQKVQQSAEKNGMAPLAFADGVSANFRTLASTLLATHDDFVRTTEERHKV
jgi:leucyl-tRNA synthetase